ncbi:MAG: hypothetical protein CVT94_18720 [Bacteroidetes bacterium HGW-Bacteroidetes-11]|jgi:hypothetical protein|nr:MAG: hypothetical protein CVT94_18720 [Bacteroidetes bacterium HGW-Bacteroidetes-11]
MKKNNKHPTETEIEDSPANSENVFENVKYIKKLALQRSVLNKLVGTDKALPAADQNENSSSPDSNQSQTNK